MSKKVAVITFNPVNGSGLFQYLECFFENEIAYKTFAIGESNVIKTNSGIEIKLDGKVEDLKGHESEYDALVFSCGDAMLKFGDIAESASIADTFSIIQKFNKQEKVIAGHCAASAIFEMAGIIEGKKVAIHPFGKANVKKGIATDEKFMVDKNMYTAQCENSIWMLLPELLKVLR